MSSSTIPSITLSDVGLAWPDGTTALSGVTGTFNLGRTGLTGLNGSGKSTLLRLIAGELTPSTGHIATSAPVSYLPQTLPLAVDATVADLLGVTARVAALRAIEAGDPAERHFEVLDEDWDIESRAAEALRSVGLSEIGLDRRVARTRLADAVRTWRGTLVIVSHDTALLELMDHTAELHDGQLDVFGGPYSAWREHLAEQQGAAARAERAAEQVVKTEKRQRVEAQTKLARRARYARTDFENKRRPKIVMQQRKTEAQVSAGKLRTELDDKVQAAQAQLSAAQARVRDDAQIRIDLPDPTSRPVGASPSCTEPTAQWSSKVLSVSR